jgi:REP element-mobilizing transposase RayT
MARPLRVQFHGGLYHVTARGNGREPIFADDTDHERFLDVLARVVARYHVLCHAYSLMGNHYHLLLETPEANLSRTMQQLNGVYSQGFNRRHGRPGHVLEGRYHAQVVDKEAYLRAVCRYIVLNPVRAGLVEHPREWRWSSYRATAGLAAVPAFLTVDWVLSLGEAPVPGEAERRYRQFVDAGTAEAATSAEGVHAGLVVGDAADLAPLRERLEGAALLAEISRAERFALRPSLSTLFAGIDLADRAARDACCARAVRDHGYTLKSVAAFVGVHYVTVSRALSREEEAGGSRTRTRVSECKI